MWERFKSDDYHVGDKLFIIDGSYSILIHEYVVEKITPSGQVVARRGNQIVRVNVRGKIIGDSSYSRRSVVSAKRAAELAEENAEKHLWLSVRQLADQVDAAARRTDFEALKVALAALSAAAIAIEARQGGDGGAGSVHDGPGQQDIAQ